MSIYLADNTVIIKQGVATSNINVTNQGSGTVTTHIQSTVNGQTQTLDSNQSGTYSLHMDSNGNSTTTSSNPQAVTLTPGLSVTPSLSITPTTPAPTPTLVPKQKTTIHTNNFLIDLFRRIFSFLFRFPLKP